MLHCYVVHKAPHLVPAPLPRPPGSGASPTKAPSDGEQKTPAGTKTSSQGAPSSSQPEGQQAEGGDAKPTEDGKGKSKGKGKDKGKGGAAAPACPDHKHGLYCVCLAGYASHLIVTPSPCPPTLHGVLSQGTPAHAAGMALPMQQAWLFPCSRHGSSHAALSMHILRQGEGPCWNEATTRTKGAPC